MKDLLAYLYGDSQIESEVEDLKEAIDRIMEEAEKEEPLKPKRTPLVNALKSLGLDDVGSEIEYDPEGFSLVCGEEDEYRRYTTILLEPDSMEKLAKLGWVVTRCGDVAMTGEPPEFRIRFLEITTIDPEDKENWPAGNYDVVKNAVKKGREFMDEPGPHDDDGPMEYDDKTSDDNQKGMGDAKDGADPKGTPKGGSKKESQELVEQLLSGVNEGGHKAGCQCGFCKNMGKGFKKKADGDAKENEEDHDVELQGRENDGGKDKTTSAGGSSSSGSGSSGSGTEATSVFKVEGCARCGETHENLIFERLESPVRNLTHWAECPNTGQPILMRMTEDKRCRIKNCKGSAVEHGLCAKHVESQKEREAQTGRHSRAIEQIWKGHEKGRADWGRDVGKMKEDLANRKGRPKAPIKDKPVAKAPKTSMKVKKAYRTPKK